MLRRLLFCLALISLAPSATAQTGRTLDAFIGEWEPAGPPPALPGRRVTPVSIEITETPRLGSRLFNVRIRVRCMDRPEQVCDVGTFPVTPPNDNQLPITMTPRRGNPLNPCGFNMVLTYGAEGVPKNQLYYSISPPNGVCAPSAYSGIERSGGILRRTVRLRLPPGALPRPLPQPAPLPPPPER